MPKKINHIPNAAFQVNYDKKIDSLDDFPKVYEKAHELRKFSIHKTSVHISVNSDFTKLLTIFSKVQIVTPQPRILLFNLGDNSLLEVHFNNFQN